jgi:DNA-binding transcriptional LysR family regulator
MKIDELKDFITLYRCRNFSEAAAERMMTQSSLSKRLQAVQQEAGSRLINTQNKRHVRITDCGEVFYRYAKTIVTQYDLMQNEIQEYRDLKRGNLWIASIPVISRYGFIEIFTRFMKDYPQINIRLEEIEGDVLLSKLKSSVIDIGIIRDIQTASLDRSDYHIETVDRDELMAILPKSSPLAGRSILSIDELRNNDFVLLNHGSGVFEVITGLCQKAGFTPKICFYSTHINTLMGIIKAPQQVTFIFKRAAKWCMNDQLVMRPLYPRIFSNLQLICVKNQNTSAVRLFLKYVKLSKKKR